MEPKKCRQRVRPQNRWSREQTIVLLEAIFESVKDDPQKFEKPTATIFYTSLFKNPKLDEFSKMGIGVVKNKIRNLKESFIRAQNWCKQTGAGLLELGEDKSVEDYINKMCPHFELLNGIFGQRKNVSLPYHFDTDDGEVEYLVDTALYETEECGSVLEESNALIEEPTLDFTEEQTPNQNSVHKFKHAMKQQVPNKKAKSSINFLSLFATDRNEIEKERLTFEIENYQNQNDVEKQKLELQKENFEFSKQLEFAKLEFEKYKFEKEHELKKQEKENELELKKFELELKYRNM